MNTFTFIEHYPDIDPVTSQATADAVYRGLSSDGRIIVVMEDVYTANVAQAPRPDDWLETLDNASAWEEIRRPDPEPELDPDLDYRVSPPVRSYPPREVTDIERLSWGL